MRFPRIRYSLRTLLLATILAGGVMLVWRVWQPWALRTLPLVKAHGTPYPYTGPICETYSPSGEFALVLENEFGLLDSRQRCMLRLRDGQIIHTYPEDTFWEWHPSRDIFLKGIRNKGVQIIQMPDHAVLAEFDSSKSNFTFGRRYLKEYGTDYERIIFRDTLDWKIVAAFPSLGTQGYKYKHLSVSADDQNIVASQASRKDRALSDFNRGSPIPISELAGENGAPLYVELLDIQTGALKWRWRAPDHVRSVKADFDETDASITATCEITKAEHAPRDADKDYDLKVKLSAETGNVLGQSVVERTYDVFFGGGYFPWESYAGIFRSADMAWKCRVCDTTIEIEDALSGHRLGRASTGGIKISLKSGSVAPNKKYLLACLENDRLAIWTRTRQHFEWWGMYERWETWLAFALLCAFVWSVWRDWKTRAGA